MIWPHKSLVLAPESMIWGHQIIDSCARISDLGTLFIDSGARVYKQILAPGSMIWTPKSSGTGFVRPAVRGEGKGGRPGMFGFLFSPACSDLCFPLSEEQFLIRDTKPSSLKKVYPSEVEVELS